MIRVPAVWLWDPKHSGYIGPRDVVIRGWIGQQLADELRQPLWNIVCQGLGLYALTAKEMCTKGDFVEDDFTIHR